MADREKELAIEIFPYDPKAPDKFEKVKEFLVDLIPFPFEAEHIGSSAVVGLGGKRVIDTLVIVEEDKMREIVKLLESKGYKFVPEEGFGIHPERFFISGPFTYEGEEIHVHYHITFPGSNEHRDKLLFRDYLRRHPIETKIYYNMKKDWSAKAGPDKMMFAELKTPYIAEVLERARKELKKGD
jgi:GrpB-like predicted nucleotidyltransferase (UPF0157 family)